MAVIKILIDTEFMLGKLQGASYTFTDDETEADIIIINSCCFINDAKEESVQYDPGNGGIPEERKLQGSDRMRMPGREIPQ